MHIQLSNTKGSGPSHRAPPELHLKTENLESIEGFAWEEAPQGKMGRQEERRCRVGVRKILIKTPEGGREGGGERDHSQMARALTKINFARRATLNQMGRAGRGGAGAARRFMFISADLERLQKTTAER